MGNIMESIRNDFDWRALNSIEYKTEPIVINPIFDNAFLESIAQKFPDFIENPFLLNKIKESDNELFAENEADLFEAFVFFNKALKEKDLLKCKFLLDKAFNITVSSLKNKTINDENLKLRFDRLKQLIGLREN